MSGARGYLLAGVAAYLLMLVATFPARQAWRLAPAAARAVSFYALDGSVWAGRAAGARIGPLDFGPLRWDVGLLRLPLGQVRVYWSAAGDRGPAGRGSVQVGLWGGLQLPDLTLRVPASALQRALPVPVTLDGTLDLRLHGVEIAAGQLQHAAGTIAWRDAAVRWSGPVALGTLLLKLDPHARPLRGTLESRGGPLTLGGTVRLLPGGRLQLDAAVKPHADAPKALVAALRAGGAPDRDGRFHIRWNGRLPPM